MSIGCETDKENVKLVHNGILCVTKRKWDFEIGRKMNGIWKYNTG